MNFSLQPFQSREAFQLDYSVPPDDSLLGTNLPETPVMVSVAVGTLTFKTVPNAVWYKIYRRSLGPTYEEIEIVDAVGTPTQTFTNGSVTAPAFYRVVAATALGDSSPSNALFLEAPPEVSCDLFDSISWGSPSFSNTNSGTSSAVAVAKQVSLEAHGESAMVISSGLAHIVGTLAYDVGSPRDCQIRVSDFVLSTYGSYIQVTITHTNSGTILNSYLTDASDINFTLPATTGDTPTITFTFEVSAGAGDTPDGLQDAVATFNIFSCLTGGE